MKLAYITSAYGRASDTFIRSEIRHLRALGHNVSTYSIRMPEAAHEVDTEVAAERTATTYILEQGIFSLLFAAIFELIRNPFRFFGALCLAGQLTGDGVKCRLRQIAYCLEAAFLARCLRKGGIQHIHDHIGENSAVVAAVAAKLVQIPFSLTLHGPSVFYAPEQFRLSRKIHHAAFCACISDFARSQCMCFTPASEWEKLRIVRCAANSEFVSVGAVAVPDVSHFLTIGRLSPEKGQHLLIDAIAALREQGTQATLDIIGDGPSRDALQLRINELGLQDSIQILGWKNTNEIIEQLKLARVFVLPSFAEGLPVVLMESLLLGRPVITTAIAGVPELVEQGVNGWLVPPGSAEALTTALRQVLETPVAKLTDMGLQGREKVLKQHDAAVEAAKLAELFQKAAK